MITDAVRSDWPARRDIFAKTAGEARDIHFGIQNRQKHHVAAGKNAAQFLVRNDAEMVHLPAGMIGPQRSI